MPTSYIETYFPVLVQMHIAVLLGAALAGIAFIIGRRVKNRVKETAYECGITPLGNAKERFSVKFYLVAMLFILFDIEAIFLYPWAVVYRDLKLFGFVEMLLFIALVISGFYYIYKKGVLDWGAQQSPAEKPAAVTPGEKHAA
jgi:NADH-quinone oxidoreductase subunit A